MRRTPPHPRRVAAGSRLQRTAVYLAMLVLLACSSGGARTSRGSSSVITRSELNTLDLSTAYDAVQRLRPHFLRGRGSTSIRDPNPVLPVVYIAGVKQGGPEALQRVRVSEVEEIRYIGASDATTRYGTGHTGGAIEVILR
jgi:hypothetical protein